MVETSRRPPSMGSAETTLGAHWQISRDCQRQDRQSSGQTEPAVVGPRPAPQGTEGTEKVSQSRSATSRRILLTGNGDFYVVNHVVPSKNALTL